MVRVALRFKVLAIGVAGLLAVVTAMTPSAQAGPPASFFGVNAVSPTGEDFRRMGSGGLGSYRVTLFWQEIQRERGGELFWRATDELFRDMAETGLKPFPILYGTPQFVGKRLQRRIKPPVRNAADRREWRRFIKGAIERYGKGGAFWSENPELVDPKVRYWQIWNEQNAEFYWNPRPRPKEYARLLKISDRAARRADPAARLVLGGMYGYPGSRRALYARKFLNQLYRQPKVKRYFEGVAVHPYGGSLADVRRQLRAARTVMRRNGDGRTGLWVSESGWSTEGDPRNFLVVSEGAQRRKLLRTMELYLDQRKRWRIRAAFWFVWRDYPEPGACPWCGGAGLLERDGDSKPAWKAYKRLIKRSS